MEVVPQHVYHDFLAHQGIDLSEPGVGEVVTNDHTLSADNLQSDLDARASCDLTTSVVVDRTQSFVGWDVQMSPVVIGSGNAGITIRCNPRV